MTRRSRLKEYNGGAVIPLRKEDLFHAFWCPVSLGVHQVKILGEPDGHIEYGEYFTKREGIHFSHSVLQLSESELSQLNRALDSLRSHPTTPPIDQDDEEAERRAISLWVQGAEQGYDLPRLESRSALGVTDSFVVAFEAAWATITGVVAAHRTDAPSILRRLT